MSLTITAFDREAEAFNALTVDELIRISNMENGAERDQNIFEKNAGVDALFELKPTNYEMNNRDTFLTARKIVKMTKDEGCCSIKTESPAQTEESIMLDKASDVTTTTTGIDAAQKGRNHQSG